MCTTVRIVLPPSCIPLVRNNGEKSPLPAIPASLLGDVATTVHLLLVAVPDAVTGPPDPLKVLKPEN